MSARQGSASFALVIGGVAAVFVGAIALTFLVFPFYNTFTAASFWSASTAPGARLIAVTEGIWRFWGAIILIAILAWVWVTTRQ